MSPPNATTFMGEPLAITGLGAVTAAGAGVRAFRLAQRRRESFLGPMARLEGSGLSMAVGGSVPEEALGHGPRSPGSSRILALSVLAVAEALGDGGLAPGDRLKTGISLGTALGAVEELEALARAQRSGGLTADEARARRRALPLNDITERLAERFGLGGPRSTFSVTCTSGNCSLEQAACDLRLGRADAVLVGGAETLGLFMQAGFCSMKALSPSGHLKPFSPERDGIVLGEGAAFVLVELLSAARRRGARVRGILAGNRLKSDASHLTSCDESGAGMASAISAALEEARVEPADVGAVTVTAVGSPVYDRMQSRAIGRAFGAAAARVPVTTWETSVGHALASTAILGLIHAAQTLEEGEVLPVRDGKGIDPACTLRYILEGPLPLAGRAVLALTVGFGGQNGVSVVVASGEAP